VAGIIAPIVTGFAVDRTGNFAIAFAIAAGVTAAGIVGWLLLSRIETLDWNARAA
jgi:Flp pilus assembly protein TadG